MTDDAARIEATRTEPAAGPADRDPVGRSRGAPAPASGAKLHQEAGGRVTDTSAKVEGFPPARRDDDRAMHSVTGGTVTAEGEP